MSFWTDDIGRKKVVVTGASGFLGHHVVKELQENTEATVIPWSSKDVCLLNEDKLFAELHSELPHVIIHLAATVGGIGANIENPGRFFYENMKMGINLIELSRLLGVEKLTLIGTVCSYPNFTPVPFKEEEIWNGYPEKTNAPYGLAKKMLFVQSQAYRDQYDFNSICLLPVNLYGPHDHFHPSVSHVIPALIKKIVDAKEENKSEILCWGTGSATREFLYAGDCARGIRLATETLNHSEPINIGSGMEISIKELVETIADILEFKGEIKWDPTKPDGQPRRCLDTSKAKEQFGFEAETDFRTGLEKTIEWYLENQDNAE